MSQNVELKARLDSLDDARRIAERIATAHLGTLRQVDTYFNCRTGRLKLREIDDGTVELIAYHRSDVQKAAVSDYLRCVLESAQPVKAALSAALGVWVVVSKRREVFLWDSVRIHLDLVAGLGHFIEFEDVLAAGMARDDRRVNELMKLFELPEEQLVGVSYSDLLAEGSAAPEYGIDTPKPRKVTPGEANC